MKKRRRVEALTLLRLGNARCGKQQIDWVLLSRRHVDHRRGGRRIAHAEVHFFRGVVAHDQHVRALPALRQASRAFHGDARSLGVGDGLSSRRRRRRDEVAEGVEQRRPPALSAAVLVVAHFDHALLLRRPRRRRKSEGLRTRDEHRERAHGREGEEARACVFDHGDGDGRARRGCGAVVL